jgi:hypothetical protein
MRLLFETSSFPLQITGKKGKEGLSQNFWEKNEKNVLKNVCPQNTDLRFEVTARNFVSPWTDAKKREIYLKTTIQIWGGGGG